MQSSEQLEEEKKTKNKKDKTPHEETSKHISENTSKTPESINQETIPEHNPDVKTKKKKKKELVLQNNSADELPLPPFIPQALSPPTEKKKKKSKLKSEDKHRATTSLN